MNPVFQANIRRVFAAKCRELYAYQPMFHKNAELIYVTGGALEFIINGQEICVEEGDLCFTFPYAVHSNRYQTAEYIFITFDPDLCAPFSPVLLGQTPRFPCLKKENVPDIVPRLLERAAQIQEESSQDVINATTLGYLAAIIGECLPALDMVSVDTVKTNTVQEILIYCTENFRSDISLRQIAADLHISPNHVSSIFSKKLKISLRDYINNLRINEATQLLTHTDKRITEIMQECGFANQSTFNKVFYEICGITPRQFRKHMLADQTDED